MKDPDPRGLYDSTAIDTLSSGERSVGVFGVLGVVGVLGVLGVLGDCCTCRENITNSTWIHCMHTCHSHLWITYTKLTYLSDQLSKKNHWMIENRERGNPRELTGKFTISLARKKLQMIIIFQFVKHVPRVRACHLQLLLHWIQLFAFQ